MENKFVLVNWLNEIAVKHVNCFIYAVESDPNWETRTLPNRSDFDHCCGCKTRIPEHILLQWKLIYDGKR